MRILFDNGTPKPIAASLLGHEVYRSRHSFQITTVALTDLEKIVAAVNAATPGSYRQEHPISTEPYSTED